MKPAESIAISDMPFHERQHDMADVCAAPVHTDVDYYEHAVPQFAAEALDCLYGSIFSTLDQFEQDDAVASACTYVERRQGKIETLLLLRRDDNAVTVINQMVWLDHTVIERFVRTIWARYPTVSAITFLSIQTERMGSWYPVQRFHCAEDIVAPLPRSRQAYLGASQNSEKIVR